MRLKPIIQRVVVYGFLAVSLNYFGLPLGSSASLALMKQTAKKKEVQKVCKVDEHLDNIVENMNKDSELLYTLKSAHALSSKWLHYGRGLDNINVFGEGRKALKKGEADCSYFSTFAYSNFLYLADKLEKPELKDKVRLCVGSLRNSKKEVYGFHAWLQVYLDNEWKDYEATFDFISKKTDLDFKNLDSLFYDDFLFDCEGYNSGGHIHFKDGKLVTDVEWLDSFGEGADFKDLLGFAGKDIAKSAKVCYKDLVDFIKSKYKEYKELDSEDSSIVHKMQVLS